MSSRGSPCSAASFDARPPSRSRAPTCACSPSSSRSRSCAARTSAASSCTSCCASTRPSSSQPDRPTRSRRPASAMRATTSAMLAERRAALVGQGVVGARDELRRELDNLRAAAEWAGRPGRRTRHARYSRAWTCSSRMHSWFEGAETFERLVAVAGDADDPAVRPSRSRRSTYRTRARQRARLRRGARPARPRVPARPPRARNMTRELGRVPAARSGIECGATGTSTRRRWRSSRRPSPIACSAGDGLDRGGALIVARVRAAAAGRPRAARGRPSRRPARRPSDLGNPLLLAYALSKLGLLADAEERYADAMRLHMEANELFAGVGDVGGAGYALEPREPQRVRDGATTRRRCGSGVPATRRSARSTTAGA